MYELILLTHVVAGIAAIVSSMHALVPRLVKLKSLFVPSLVTVSASGVGLLFTGASTARVCISGTLMTVAVIVIHKISVRKNIQVQPPTRT